MFFVIHIISKKKIHPLRFLIALHIAFGVTSLGIAFVRASGGILLLLCLFIYIHSQLQSRLESVILILLTGILVMMGSYSGLIFSDLVCFKLLKMPAEFENTLTFSIVFLFFELTLWLILALILSKTYSIIVYKNIPLSMRATKVILVLMALLFAGTYIPAFSYSTDRGYVYVFMGAFLTMIPIISLIYYNGLKSAELKSKEIQIHQLNDYLNNVETLNFEMRKFKHDYKNILIGLNGYIEENDLEGLKEYMYEHIFPYEDNIDKNLTELNNLSYIKLIELKGLLSFKLSYAIEIGIKVTIGIHEEIDSIHMDIVDLCRVIGILLDNAIEASAVSDERYIHFIINHTENAILIAVENSTVCQLPTISKMYEQGFTTKADHSGLGLISLRKILDNYAMSIETTSKDSTFSQVLCISNT